MRAAIAALAGLALLGGCASADPAMYVLRAVPGQPIGGGPVAVRVARPGIAGYLDRPEIVRDGLSNRLTLRGGERWGEPIGDMIGRVVSLDLSQRLPGSSVFTEAGTISVDPSATVEFDVQRFDLDVDGTVVLLVQLAVQVGRAHDPNAARSIRVTAQPTGPGTPELVTAESQALGQLADQIAAQLRQLPSAPPTRLSKS